MKKLEYKKPGYVIEIDRLGYVNNFVFLNPSLDY